MAAKAKRRAEKAAKLVDHSEDMTLNNAIAVLRAVEVGHPNTAYEVFVKTEIRNGVAVPKGRMNLPREAKNRQKDKILVFAEGRQAEEALKAGADVVGGPELIDAVLSNKVKPTTVLSTPALIRTITPKLGRFLGPLGLMPSERRGTVTDDIPGYIRRIQGSSEWKADRTGNIRLPVALMNFPVDDVVKNFRYLMTSVKVVTGNSKDPAERRALNSGPKPVTKISKVILSTRQGPGIKITDY